MKTQREQGNYSNVSLTFKKNFFKRLLIFDRERDTHRGQVGEGQKERDTQKLKQAPGSELSAQSPSWDLKPQTVRS